MDNLRDLKYVRYVNRQYKLYTSNSKCKKFNEREEFILKSRMVECTKMVMKASEKLDDDSRVAILAVASFIIGCRVFLYHARKQKRI
jgi:hypothetical protein